MEQLAYLTREVFLHPGEFHFGPAPGRIKTLLGSCVAVTVWHPARRCGGMCHIVLPSRQRPFGALPDGRYANEAIERFIHELSARRIDPAACRVKLFGGGNMFGHGVAARLNIGERNVEATRIALAAYGFPVLAEHVGGMGQRRIGLDLSSGRVWMQSRNGQFFDSFTKKTDAQNQSHDRR